MKRNIKDSVFTLMFRQSEYALQLYKALHPEDDSVTEADCKVVTLEHVLTTGQYNDLGLQVRNMLLLLIEAQSTFTINIVLRILMYLAATYKEYVEEHKLDLYGSKAVTIPRPELYVIYTGPEKDVPDALHLSDLYEGAGSVDLEVKVCTYRGTMDILDQYVRFCEISNENRNKYGRTEQAVEETLRQCMKENILAPFLASREKEVRDIMVTLFDQEKIQEIHDYNVAQEAEQKGVARGIEQGIEQGMEKGIAQGIEQGEERGVEKGIRAMVSTMRELAVSRDIIIQKIAQGFELPSHTAAEKVAQYWGS